MRSSACALVLLLWLTAAVGGEERLAYSPDARVRVMFDQTEYFLGENILIHFCVENVGTKPFGVTFGGDYRGMSRNTRFQITALDEHGAAVLDPGAIGSDMGGMVYGPQLATREKHWESLQLARYCRFERAGAYRVRATHDLGWQCPPGLAPPVGEATLILKMPTPAEARAVLEKMDRLPPNHGVTAGQRNRPYADHTALAYEVYLPLVAARARNGEEKAVAAVAAIPTAEATELLVELTGHMDGKIALQALRSVSERLPLPDKERARGFGTRGGWLAQQTWQPRLAVSIRACASRLLAERPDPDTAWHAAWLLERLGEVPDAPVLIQALEREILRLASTAPGHERLRARDIVNGQLRAAEALQERGLALPVTATTPAYKVLWLRRLGRDADFRPPGWEAAYARLLRDETAYVREQALLYLPTAQGKDLLRPLASLCDDPDLDVRGAACSAAARFDVTDLRTAVARVARTTTDKSLFRTASGATRQLSQRWDWLELIVARLEEPGLTEPCLQELMAVIGGFNGYSHSGGYKPEQARTLKKGWQKFLDEHEKDLRAGKQWRFNAPGFPTPELFPGYHFYSNQEPRVGHRSNSGRHGSVLSMPAGQEFGLQTGRRANADDSGHGHYDQQPDRQHQSSSLAARRSAIRPSLGPW
jgi:hypothetical protein